MSLCSPLVDPSQIGLHAVPVFGVNPELAEYIALRPHPVPQLAHALCGVLHLICANCPMLRGSAKDLSVVWTDACTPIASIE